MLIFLKKIFVFLFPPAMICFIIGIPSFYVAYNSREILHLNEMIDIQQEKDILIYTNIQNTDALLKYETTKILKPEILALGTSRVMQFRREYFTDELNFYNAGGGIANLPQFIDFIDGLEINPQFIILGLDQWGFNKTWAYEHKWNEYYQYEYNLFKIIINAFRILAKNEIQINQPYDYPQNIGLTARVHGDGFRSDGSYFYNRIVNHPNSEYSKKYLYPFEDTVVRINAGNHRFEYGNEIYDKSIEHIIEILDKCKERNIMVIAFLPPFAPYINTKLIENGNYIYIPKIYPALKPIFDRYGFELYDYTDSSHISNDSMYLDGFHGDDSTYHNILFSLKEQGSMLGKYIR